LPEIPGLDNLASPEGPILEAQQLAAAAFGADRTWFLVNGATCGIQAAVMATCKPGDLLILPSNCYQVRWSVCVMLWHLLWLASSFLRVSVDEPLSKKDDGKGAWVFVQMTFLNEPSHSNFTYRSCQQNESCKCFLSMGFLELQSASIKSAHPTPPSLHLVHVSKHHRK
jgi:hypothetical protein